MGGSLLRCQVNGAVFSLILATSIRKWRPLLPPEIVRKVSEVHCVLGLSLIFALAVLSYLCFGSGGSADEEET